MGVGGDEAQVPLASYLPARGVVRKLALVVASRFDLGPFGKNAVESTKQCEARHWLARVGR